MLEELVNQKVFIIYDDCGQRCKVVGVVTSIDNQFIEVRTETNKLFIARSSIQKIKIKGDNHEQ